MRKQLERREVILLSRSSGQGTRPLSRLLIQGNDKLGGRIHAFNLPALQTCPGMSRLCRQECYAQRGRWCFPNVKAALARNWQAVVRPDFRDHMVGELISRHVQVVRLHVSGDFFSAAYVAHWASIAQAASEVTFYAYTRSWRVKELGDSLCQLAAVPNVQLWYSADRSTTIPSYLPPGVRIAWLETREDENVPAGVDLVFRPQRLRRTPNPLVSLSIVCRADIRGVQNKVTCGWCGRCWKGFSGRLF